MTARRDAVGVAEGPLKRRALTGCGHEWPATPARRLRKESPDVVHHPFRGVTDLLHERARPSIELEELPQFWCG